MEEKINRMLRRDEDYMLIETKDDASESGIGSTNSIKPKLRYARLRKPGEGRYIADQQETSGDEDTEYSAFHTFTRPKIRNWKSYTSLNRSITISPKMEVRLPRYQKIKRQIQNKKMKKHC